MVRTPGVLYVFTSMLHATTACTFSTSQLLQKRSEPEVFVILTCKCASRHNGVHFFDISTSKSAPNPPVFSIVDFHMCFAPQRHAIFHPHLASWLRTRRFGEPFRPSGATKHCKNTVFRDFPTFSRSCIFSLLTFCISQLLPSGFLHVRVSSWLCFFLAVLFMCPYCRNFSF